MLRRVYALVFTVLAAVATATAGCNASTSTDPGASCANGKCDSTSQSLALHSLQLLGANVAGADAALQGVPLAHPLRPAQLGRADAHLQGDLPQAGHGGARLGQLHARRSDERRLAVHAGQARLLRRRRAPHRAADAVQERLSGDGAGQQRHHLGCGSTPSSSRWCRCRAATTTSSAPTTSPPVSSWFAQDLPDLEAVLPEATPPANCVESWTPALDAHVARMKTEGWGAVNRDRGMSMFGCNGAGDALVVPLHVPVVGRQGFRAGLGRPRRHLARPARPRLPHHLLVALVGVGALRRRRRRQGHRPAAEPGDSRRGVVRPGLLPRRLGLPLSGHVASAPASATSRC